MGIQDDNFLSNSSVQEQAPLDRQASVDCDDSGKKYLSDIEALKLELSLSKLQILERNRLVLQLQLQLEEKGVQIEQLMMKEKLHIAQEKMKSLRTQMENIATDTASQKENNLTIIRQISEAHSLGDSKFGYNPETLEIISNEP